MLECDCLLVICKKIEMYQLFFFMWRRPLRSAPFFLFPSFTVVSVSSPSLPSHFFYKFHCFCLLFQSVLKPIDKLTLWGSNAKWMRGASLPLKCLILSFPSFSFMPSPLLPEQWCSRRLCSGFTANVEQNMNPEVG
jgi:hypothetical protein